MKVMQVLYSGLGGHGNVAFTLVEAARSKGAWDNALAFLGVEPLLPEYAYRCASTGAHHDYVPVVAGRAWASWLPLYRALRHAAPDAIVLHSVKAVIPCWMYARAHGVPLIGVEHQANALKKRSEWWVSRLLMRLADRVVLLTPDYRDQLQRRLGAWWRGDKVHVIPNGVDTLSYEPRAPADGAHARPRVVGMASRFSDNKRQEVLIDAMALLRDQDGPGAWQLTLAGDGETRERLERHAASRGVADMVTFAGFLAGTALRDWFQAVDIYTHASDGETLSTSLLQALASGLPIVGSDVPGIDSLLGRQGEYGLLVNQTPQAFAEAFRRLANDGELARGLAARARAHAQAKFSQTAMFDQYNGILLQLCAK